MKPAHSLLLSALLFASPTFADEVTIDFRTPVVQIPELSDYGPPLPSLLDVVMTFDSLSGTSSVDATPTSQFAQGIVFSNLSLQSWSMTADGTLLASGGSGGSVDGTFEPVAPGFQINAANQGAYAFAIGFSDGANSFSISNDLFAASAPTVASLAHDPVASFLSQVAAGSSQWDSFEQASGEWGNLLASGFGGAGVVTVTIQPSVSVPEPPLLPLMALGLAGVFLRTSRQITPTATPRAN
jgi:hypothetical protein